MRNRNRAPIKPSYNPLNSSEVFNDSHRSHASLYKSAVRDRSRELVRDGKKSLRKIRCDRIMGMLSFSNNAPVVTAFQKENRGHRRVRSDLRHLNGSLRSLNLVNASISNLNFQKNFQTDSYKPRLDFEKRRNHRKALNIMTRFKPRGLLREAFRDIKARGKFQQMIEMSLRNKKLQLMGNII